MFNSFIIFIISIMVTIIAMTRVSLIVNAILFKYLIKNLKVLAISNKDIFVSKTSFLKIYAFLACLTLFYIFEYFYTIPNLFCL